LQVLKAAVVIAKKDLLIEAKSKVVLKQILPLAGAILLIFGLTLGPSSAKLSGLAPGLIWVTALFATLFAAQRSLSLESTNDAYESFKMANLDSTGLFFGKIISIGAEVFAILILTILGAIIFYDSSISSFVDLAVLTGSALFGAIGLAAAAAIYGSFSYLTGVRETLLPLLFIPASVPLLIGGAELTSIGLTASKAGFGLWSLILIISSLGYCCIGALSFESVLENA
jgi:heme exporter protein B